MVAVGMGSISTSTTFVSLMLHVQSVSKGANNNIFLHTGCGHLRCCTGIEIVFFLHTGYEYYVFLVLFTIFQFDFEKYISKN